MTFDPPITHESPRVVGMLWGFMIAQHNFMMDPEVEVMLREALWYQNPIALRSVTLHVYEGFDRGLFTDVFAPLLQRIEVMNTPS